ncbi:tol-pal system YbgF family protein [Campylobacter fetus]
MRRDLFIAAFLWAASSLFAEISVFDAGNLNQDNPYGLTDNEKILLKNKEKVEKLNQNIGSVQSDINVAQENIEGLRSILDGLNQTNLKLENRATDLENRVNYIDLNLTKEITELKSIVKQNKTIQDENYKKITKAISELSALIDSVVANQAAEKNSSSTIKDNKIEDTKSVTKFDDMNLADVLKDADTSYNNKEYLKASEAYAFLVKKKHKPAYSNFMLGEIEYTNKNYKDAIPYYQKSVELSQKGTYMPKLLYHTAISFDKIGDTKNANKFYNALRQAYPDSKEAKASPVRK